MANKLIQLTDGTNNLFPVSKSLTKSLTSSDDLDDLKNTTDTGLYYIETNVANAPEDWGTLVVNVRSGGGCTQIAVYVQSVYIRLYTGTPLAWSSWRRYDFNELMSSSISIDSGMTATTNTVKRTGHVCEISLYVESTNNFTKGSWVRIGVVPSGYRPDHNMYFMCLDNTNGIALETRVTAAGQLSIWAPSSAPNFKLFAANITYFV